MQRSTSTISITYENDTSGMDSEICSMFGSLSLRGWSLEEEKASRAKQLIVEDSYTRPQIISPGNNMHVEADTLMEMTDIEGNVQIRPAPPSSSYPNLEIYAPISSSTSPSQFIDTRTSPQIELHDKGCGLLHVLAAHYTPCMTNCGRKDPDFNLLDTILAHREAFVAFPRAHRTCSAALTEIAFALERKHNAQMPYKGDESDLDTAVALHNEAWLMSGWYST